MNENKAVRANTSIERKEIDLERILGDTDLLEMPFDFTIYLMGSLSPVLVPRGIKKAVFN